MSLVRLLPRFQKAYAALPEFAERETWSRRAIGSYQLDRINELWAHAVQHVPYYRRLIERENLPRQFSTLSEFSETVPPLEKSAVRQQRMQFLSAAASSGNWVVTGGSTGAPTRVFRSHEAHRSMLRSRYRFHRMWDVDIFDRWAFLWGHAASFAPGFSGFKDRLLRPIGDRLRNRLRLSVYELGEEDLRRHLDRIAAFRPAAIYTYSSAGYLLALQAEKVGFECDSLRMINLTSEPVHDYIRATVQRVFGVPVVVEYGSVECGFLAGQWPDGTLRIREDQVFLETIEREDAGYEIFVTVLGNESFPLVRYQIGDFSHAPIEYPERGFAILPGVAGRNIDLITTRTGRKLHGILFEEILEKYPGFRRWRVHQLSDGQVDVQIENYAPVSPDTLAAVELRLRDVVEGFKVTAKLVRQLPPTPAGKHRSIISDLASDVVPIQSTVVGRQRLEPIRSEERGTGTFCSEDSAK